MDQAKPPLVQSLGFDIKHKVIKYYWLPVIPFVAAATEQLISWCNRLNLEVISGHHGADSAAVAFDAYASAMAKNADLLLVDTAGRLHVKDNLMDELTKLKRVLQKNLHPHHIIVGW